LSLSFREAPSDETTHERQPVEQRPFRPRQPKAAFPSRDSVRLVLSWEYLESSGRRPRMKPSWRARKILGLPEGSSTARSGVARRLGT
jgi:hypothetical protein